MSITLRPWTSTALLLMNTLTLSLFRWHTHRKQKTDTPNNLFGSFFHREMEHRISWIRWIIIMNNFMENTLWVTISIPTQNLFLLLAIRFTIDRHWLVLSKQRLTTSEQKWPVHWADVDREECMTSLGTSAWEVTFIVRQIRAKFHKNCGFCGKSTKLHLCPGLNASIVSLVLLV